MNDPQPNATLPQPNPYTPSPIMRHFAWDHLPRHLQDISRPVGELAQQMDRQIAHCAEKTAGLRKLLEAKDCLVRAYLEWLNGPTANCAPQSVRMA